MGNTLLSSCDIVLSHGVYFVVSDASDLLIIQASDFVPTRVIF